LGKKWKKAEQRSQQRRQNLEEGEEEKFGEETPEQQEQFDKAMKEKTDKKRRLVAEPELPYGWSKGWNDLFKDHQII